MEEKIISEGDRLAVVMDEEQETKSTQISSDSEDELPTTLGSVIGSIVVVAIACAVAFAAVRRRSAYSSDGDTNSNGGDPEMGQAEPDQEWTACEEKDDTHSTHCTNSVKDRKSFSAHSVEDRDSGSIRSTKEDIDARSLKESESSSLGEEPELPGSNWLEYCPPPDFIKATASSWADWSLM